MATVGKTKPLRLLNLVVELPEEIQKLLPSKLKEIQSREHPLLLETLQQMRDTETVIFELDTVFSCVLSFLLLDCLHSRYNKDLYDEVEAILSSALEKEPDNLIALCIKQELRKTKATKEKIKTLVDRQDILYHAYAVIAFYLYKLDPRNITASIRLFQQSIKVWEDDGKGDTIKVIVWKLLLAEVYGEMWDKETISRGFDSSTTMIRVNQLLQSGITLETEQDIPLRYLAARSYATLAWTYSKYQMDPNQNKQLEELEKSPDIKHWYKLASKLCDGKDPYVMEKYGIFIRTTARTICSLENAAKIFESVLSICPYRHVAAYHLALTYKALWALAEGLPQGFIYLNCFHDEGEDNTSMKEGTGCSKETGSHRDKIVGATNPIRDNIRCKRTNISKCDCSEGAVRHEGAVKRTIASNTESCGSLEGAVGGNVSSGELSKDNSEGVVGKEDSTKEQENKRSVGCQTTICACILLQNATLPSLDYAMLKAENPVTYSSHYLDLVKHFLAKANESAKERKVVYLIELARVHISCGEDAAAFGYFENAKRALRSNFGHWRYKDRAYLYEQWALLFLKQVERHDRLEYVLNGIGRLRELSANPQQMYNIMPQQSHSQLVRIHTNTVSALKPFVWDITTEHVEPSCKTTTKYIVEYAEKYLLPAIEPTLKQLEETLRQLEKTLEEIENYRHKIETYRWRIDILQQQTENTHLICYFQHKIETCQKIINNNQKMAKNLQEVIKNKQEIMEKDKGIGIMKQMCNWKMKRLQSSYGRKHFEETLRQAQSKASVEEETAKYLLGKHLEDNTLLGDLSTNIENELEPLEQFNEMIEVITSEVSDAECSQCHIERLNRIECYFLISCRSAVKINSKPQLAYYKLAEMLTKAVQSDPSSPKWMILCEICQLVGEYEKAQRLLKNRDMTAPKARQLFKQQSIQDEEYGKYLDLSYVIHHNTPDESLKHDIVEMQLRMTRHSLSSSPGLGDNEPFKAYGEALKIFLKDAASSHPSRAQSNKQIVGDDSNVLVFMARSEDDETSGFNYIAERLKQCGIQVRRYLKRSLDDFEMGCNTRVEIMKTIENCHLILVSDFTDKCPMADSLPPVSFIVEEARQCERRIPILILQETEDPAPEDWKNLPRVDIRGVNTDVKFHDFMTEVFQNICPKKCSHCKNTLHQLTETAAFE